MHLHLITGSTLGAAEYVADHINDLLEQHNISATIHNQPDLSQLDPNAPWLLICSTHGAGELPDNIQPFYSQLQQRTDLRPLRYGVIGLGDSNYDTFCAAAYQLDEVLIQGKAARILPQLNIDVSQHPVPEEQVEPWLSTFLSALCE
ncbi:FMN-binding protein MioC [Thaumasiovibrio sp. DFM-14]|uniref:FMN-binding protein MioC n=1 Tax=Thaumasiovibrio sp. DFM-14 TaxID=3384792 RepID=UPI0039A1D337